MIVYNTYTEQFAQVPVTLGNVSEWRSIYFIPISNVKKDDILQIFAEGQVVNNLGYNVELGQIITIQSNVFGGTEDITIPEVINASPVNGWNISANTHYGRFSKVHSYKVEEDRNVLYIMLRLRARSTGAISGHALSVNLGQGQMFVNMFRG